MKQIQLTQNRVVLVDDEDYNWLNQWKWCYFGRYVARADKRQNGKQKMIWMHRLIAQTPDGMETDHINGNHLDNRRENLRIATKSQNMANQKRSGYKGVSWHKRLKKFQGSIQVNKQSFHLGYFDSALEAAQAYNQKAIELFGKFAKLNEYQH